MCVLCSLLKQRCAHTPNGVLCDESHAVTSCEHFFFFVETSNFDVVEWRRDFAQWAILLLHVSTVLRRRRCRQWSHSETISQTCNYFSRTIHAAAKRVQHTTNAYARDGQFTENLSASEPLNCCLFMVSLILPFTALTPNHTEHLYFCRREYRFWAIRSRRLSSPIYVCFSVYFFSFYFFCFLIKIFSLAHIDMGYF